MTNMKFEIKTVYHEVLEEYKNVLDNYNAEYHHEDEDETSSEFYSHYGHYAIIEIDKLEDVLELRKQLEDELIFVGNGEHFVGRKTKYTDLECIVIKNGPVD